MLTAVELETGIITAYVDPSTSISLCYVLRRYGSLSALLMLIFATVLLNTGECLWSPSLDFETHAHSQPFGFVFGSSTQNVSI